MENQSDILTLERKYIVGEKECSFSMVIDAIRKCEAGCLELSMREYDFWRKLGLLSYEFLSSRKRNEEFDCWLNYTLEKWRAAQGENATLDCLADHFKEMELTSLYKLLHETFNQSTESSRVIEQVNDTGADSTISLLPSAQSTDSGAQSQFFTRKRVVCIPLCILLLILVSILAVYFKNYHNNLQPKKPNVTDPDNLTLPYFKRIYGIDYIVKLCGNSNTTSLVYKEKLMCMSIIIHNERNFNITPVLVFSGLVKEISLMGTTNENIIAMIFKHFNGIHSLVVDNENITNCSYKGSSTAFVKVELPYLNKLILSNISACPEFYTILSNTKLPSLVEMKLLNSVFSDENVVSVQNLFRSVNSSLKYLEIDLYSVTNKLFYAEVSLRRIVLLKLNIHKSSNIKDTRDDSILGQRFCNSFSGLQIFVSETGIYLSELPILSECLQLANISTSALLNENQHISDLNVYFTRHNLHIFNLTIYVYTSKQTCPFYSHINRLGLDELRTHVGKMTLKLIPQSPCGDNENRYNAKEDKRGNIDFRNGYWSKNG